ncbi:MAG: acyltransferase [Verrucomicrobiota bacterium]|nr:acyltransferase [Verrucomicrobiota bacterium]
MKKLLGALSLLLPWSMRRSFLEKQFGYSIHPTSRIGFAWIFPDRLVMEANSSIGHLTLCKNIALLHLGEHAIIGRGNWITGFPLGPSPHFASETDRRPELIVGAHSAITHRHLIDCTNRITIGKFTTFAGFQSQMLTHTIDLQTSRQTSAPISIGDYCFIGTNSVLLGGSALPDYSVVGAKSLVNKAFTETHQFYGGVPARPLQTLPADYAYFTRTTGFVV